MIRCLLLRCLPIFLTPVFSPLHTTIPQYQTQYRHKRSRVLPFRPSLPLSLSLLFTHHAHLTRARERLACVCHSQLTPALFFLLTAADGVADNVAFFLAYLLSHTQETKTMNAHVCDVGPGAWGGGDVVQGFTRNSSRDRTVHQGEDRSTDRLRRRLERAQTMPTKPILLLLPPKARRRESMSEREQQERE